MMIRQNNSPQLAQEIGFIRVIHYLGHIWLILLDKPKSPEKLSLYKKYAV